MSIENTPKDNKLHSICMQNRKTAHLEGVVDVIRFDESEVLLETVCGMLSIDGEALRLSEWNTERGLATLEGRIDGIEYFDKKQEDAKAHNRLFGRSLK